MIKPSIPKGTRDFLPREVHRRRFIFQCIEKVFKTYGYSPIETPTLENLSTLTGKYGEEGDQLLFKVLNNGDFLVNADEQAIRKRDSAALIPSISKRGLRYDLTVPFARFIVMHQNDLTMPFKRYQIQPVWRADRPQKGRYQEFFQCDVDIIGSDSLINEAELVCIIDEVFSALGLKISIKLNHRKILLGMSEFLGVEEKFMELTVILDKLDKIGIEGVEQQMIKLGVNSEHWAKMFNIIREKSYERLKELLETSETASQGIAEIEEILEYLKQISIKNDLIIDVSLARGLNYYTGCIFEVELKSDSKSKSKITGSLLGGGRYDDLTGVFGLPNVSGVGVSFGAERVYDAMLEMNLFPKEIDFAVKVILLFFDKESQLYAFQLGEKLREENICTMVYPGLAKMKKQMKYADNLNIPYAIIIGPDEIKSKLLSFKNLETGQQESLSLEEIKSRLLDRL